MSEPRIVSLLPAATEIVCALGLRPALVGRSHECDHPADVASLPVCTRSRIDDASSREIDDQVRARLEDGLSLYAVETERLRELAPTAVITQDQCEVCAVSPRDLEGALAQWTGGEPALVSLHPQSLGDVWRDVLRVGEALGVPDRARAVNAELATRVAEVGEAVGPLAERPSVVCLEWLDPPMASGNWVPELVRIAGGRPLLADGGALSPRIDWDALRAADPDVLVLVPCGFDIARTRRELAALSELDALRGLRAVRSGRAALLDGNAYLNRPGPRLVESLEILAEILHPGAFDRGHRGTGWTPWPADA